MQVQSRAENVGGLATAIGVVRVGAARHHVPMSVGDAKQGAVGQVFDTGISAVADVAVGVDAARRT